MRISDWSSDVCSSDLATQGGLLFFAGTQDYYLRAFDTASGKEVWKQRLPVGSQGGPITYKSPKTGKQYVVISAGGARQSPDRGDYVIAYALPAATKPPRRRNLPQLTTTAQLNR